jgi:hypothetical protein
MSLIPSGNLTQYESDADKTWSSRQSIRLQFLKKIDGSYATLETMTRLIVIGKISDSGDIEGVKVWNMVSWHNIKKISIANERNATIVRTTKEYKYNWQISLR